MTYVVSGATGRVGSVVASRLLEAGHPVRVIVRSEAAAEEWCNRGAEAAVADLADHQSMTAALAGSTGFFAMLPFNLGAEDPDAEANKIVESVAAAVTDSAPGRVVLLSSGGADLSSGTGPIVGLHDMEQALAATGARVTALRSQHFQEKVSDVMVPATQGGVYPVFGDDVDSPISMVATVDLGRMAAEQLTKPDGPDVIDVVGPDYSERDVAQALGQRIGRELAVVPVPQDQWVGQLMAGGMPEAAARSVAEMYAADARGDLAPRSGATLRATTGLGETLDAVVGA